MFIYNSKNDEYDQVFEYEEPENGREPSVYFSRRSSLRSSRRSSIRSINSNYLTRIISKNGRRNTFLVKVPNKRLVYFRDLGNTLLHIRWRWILITLCLVNFLSFYLFGLLWMFLAYISGDFEENPKELCVVNTKNVAGYVLLSIETMLTIGYGYRYPTEKCVQGWLLPFFQALVGVGIQGVLVSAVYVKISKPYTKNPGHFFSRKAVICLRDGSLCLIIRVTDLMGKVAVGTKISMYFIDKENCSEDSSLKMQEIKIEKHGFLIFPLEIVHVINPESPLWDLSPARLLFKRIEVVVVVEGSSLVTGQLSQNRCSYIGSDILWGHRFDECVDFDSKKGKYVVDCKKISDVIPFDTPLCSARELKAIERNLALETT